MNLLSACRQTARRAFRIPSLRPEQESAMLAVLNGRDALVALPTGFGKSLIYQVPAMILDRARIPVTRYHGKMRAADRDAAQRQFMNPSRRLIMVATTAFGMGIDKPNIRYILHYQTPGSLEQYVQEIGRAGRDGHAAQCILLFDPADLEIQEHLQALGRPSVRHLERLEDALTAWKDEQRAPTPENLAYSAGVPARICEVLVSDLEEAALIKRDQEGGINIVVPPKDFKDGVRDLVAKLKTFRYEGERRLRLLPDYAQSKECRSVFLRRYFGEDHPPRCGTCDRCRADSVAVTPASPSRKARQQTPAQAPPRMYDPLPEPATPAARGLVRGESPATSGSENAHPRKRRQRSRTKKKAKN